MIELRGFARVPLGSLQRSPSPTPRWWGGAFSPCPSVLLASLPPRLPPPISSSATAVRGCERLPVSTVVEFNVEWLMVVAWGTTKQTAQHMHVWCMTTERWTWLVDVSERLRLLSRHVKPTVIGHSSSTARPCPSILWHTVLPGGTSRCPSCDRRWFQMNALTLAEIDRECEYRHAGWQAFYTATVKDFSSFDAASYLD